MIKYVLISICPLHYRPTLGWPHFMLDFLRRFQLSFRKPQNANKIIPSGNNIKTGKIEWLKYSH